MLASEHPLLSNDSRRRAHATFSYVMISTRSLSALLVGVAASACAPGSPFGDSGDGPSTLRAERAALSTPHFIDGQRLTPPVGAQVAGFGSSVAISGDTAVVGAADGEVAVVFVRQGSGWVEEQQLVPSDPSSQGFGTSLAIDGDTLLVGSPNDTIDGAAQGSAHVFMRTNGQWAVQQRLLSPSGVAGGSFGAAVALEGGVALIGAPLEGSRGSAHVFERSNSVWSDTEQLSAGGANGCFGSSVALSQNRAIVGEPCIDPGTAYAFERVNSSWTSGGLLTHNNGPPTSHGFGTSVALDGDSALVGATGTNYLGAEVGSVTVYDRVRPPPNFPSHWRELGDLLGSPDLGRFGGSLALKGDVLLVGAAKSPHALAQVFARSGLFWVWSQTVDAGGGYQVGARELPLALGNRDALIGQPEELPDGEVVVSLLVGHPCVADDDCATHFCVEGACCDAACAGPCDACSEAAGASRSGTCTVLPAGSRGSPPCGALACTGKQAECSQCAGDEDCPPEDYCAEGGACRARLAKGGACEEVATQLECLDSGCRICGEGLTCADGVCCISACDQECDVCSRTLGAADDGECEAAREGSGSCANGYACNGVALNCPASCTSDSDCSTNHYCYAPTASCQPRKEIGSPCNDLAGINCMVAGCRICAGDGGGFCVDGVCCDAPCVGGCNVCSRALGASADGTCGLLPQGHSGSPTCARKATCDGQAGPCPLACRDDRDCTDDAYCGTDAQCASKRPLAATCGSPAECESGFCADGVCCDGACDGQCEACSEPKSSGKCRAVDGSPRGERPSCQGQARCDGDGAFVDAPECRAGSCSPQEPVPCGRSRCTSNGCQTECASDDDCTLNAQCSAEGICSPRKAQGAACSRNRECDSEYCTDGVCCESACAGQCSACDLPGQRGRCENTLGPPREPRPACQGAPACDQVAGVFTAAPRCDGHGGCARPEPTPCGGFGCSNEGCFASCFGDAECTAEFLCLDRTCQPRNSKCSADGARAEGPDGELLEVCAPFTCRNGACLNACTSSNDCAGGKVCDTEAGSCVPLEGYPAKAAGCGCRVPAGRSGANGWLALTLLASFVAAIRRGRRVAAMLAAVTCANLGWIKEAHSQTNTAHESLVFVDQQWLTSPDGLEGGFGYSVALHGDRLAVGAPGAGLGGKVYLFERSGSSWSCVADLSGAALWDEFGYSVALSRDTLLVGAPSAQSTATSMRGRSYFFDLRGSPPQLAAEPQCPNIYNEYVPCSWDHLGEQVAIGNDAAVVGSWPVSTLQLHTNGAWNSYDYAPGTMGSYRGRRLAMSDTRALIGEPFNDSGRGRVWPLFVDDGVWVRQPPLGAIPAMDGFGASVAVSNDWALIGASLPSHAGAAFLFSRTNDQWVLSQRLDPPPDETGFGVSTAVSDVAALVASDSRVFLHTLSNSTWNLQRVDGGPVTSMAAQSQTVVIAHNGFIGVLVGVGGTCQSAADCASGHCVDGVCCASDCTNPCATCRRELGAFVTGICSGAKEGSIGRPPCDPFVCAGGSVVCAPCTKDAQCESDRYCAANGECKPRVGRGAPCDGSGDGTECQEPGCRVCESGLTCADGVCCSSDCSDSCAACSEARGSSENGSCEPVRQGTAAASCAEGFVCNGVGLGCSERCVTDADCAESHYCDGQSERCALRRSRGDECDDRAGQDCRTAGCRVCLGGNSPNDRDGHCVDGRCCNTACPGGCDTCSSGTCKLLPQGSAGLPRCALGLVCDGVHSQCPAGCTDDADCEADAYCDDEGQCAERRPTAAHCGQSEECASGHCVDGLCCESICDSQCKACDNPNAPGSCTAVDGAPHGSRPACEGSGHCNAAGDFVPAPLCISGSCGVPSALDCQGYHCTASGCGTRCLSEQDCSNGAYCSEAKLCESRQQDGKVCSRSTECISGQCVDGVCCDSDCKGQCAACDLPGMRGRCSDVLGPPHGGRPVCPGSPSCNAAEGTYVRAPECDGAGACAPPETESCDGLRCTIEGCLTGCSLSGDCADGFACEEGRCVQAPGRCSDDGEHALTAQGHLDKDCAPYRCAEGQCGHACAASDDCAVGFVCDTVASSCVAGTGASSPHGGCGCRVGARGTPTLELWLALTAAAGLLARKRSRRLNSTSLTR